MGSNRAIRFFSVCILNACGLININDLRPCIGNKLCKLRIQNSLSIRVSNCAAIGYCSSRDCRCRSSNRNCTCNIGAGNGLIPNNKYIARL